MARTEAFIEAPVGEVFRVLADPQSYADWVMRLRNRESLRRLRAVAEQAGNSGDGG